MTGRDLLAFWITFAVILSSDLVTKDLFPPPPPGMHPHAWWLQHDWPEWIYPAWNTGVAWSLFDEHPNFVVALTLVLVPILIIVYWRAYRHLGLGVNLGFGAIIAGALGNAWDRLWSRLDADMLGVRDWISVDLDVIGIDYIWPTFNIADSGITCGFVLLLLSTWLERKPVAPDQHD
ncbi:MAG: signal peptidase II [Planctomycetota bacterium]